MSKPISHLFYGTLGHIAFFGEEISSFIASSRNAVKIIAERIKDLDTREHIIKHKKVLSSKQMAEIRKKIEARTATIKEYKNYSMTLRFNKNRQAAVKEFWKDEKHRIEQGLPLTREWTNEQIQAILANSKPQYNGKTIQGHHTFSALKYPHLAGRSEVIYPVTFYEHLYYWHGGNFKNSVSGKPFRKSNK
jgi:hypothetical protein